MLGLPSTTEVDRVLPKRAFYEHLKLDPAARRSFVDDIESITVRNSVKPATTGIPAGVTVQEVLVLEVALKSEAVPEAALAAIARSNPHRLVFVCTRDGKACLAVLLGSLVVGPWQDAGELALRLDPTGMDQTWDLMASQAAYGDEGRAGETVEGRHATASRSSSPRSTRSEGKRSSSRVATGSSTRRTSYGSRSEKSKREDRWMSKTTLRRRIILRNRKKRLENSMKSSERFLAPATSTSCLAQE